MIVMRLKIIILFIAFLLTINSVLNAQNDTLILTLDEVMAIAHKQSPDALIAKHKFRSSYWQYRSFKADYLPGINLDATIPSFSRSFRQIPQTGGPDIFQYNTIGDYTAILSIDQKIGYTGGSVFLRTDLNRLDNYYEDSTTLTSYQSTPFVIGYRQPIFKYNEYRWAKRLEPLKYEKAKRQYLEDLENVSIRTNQYFFNLLLAQVEESIADKNLKNNDALYRIALGRYQLGKIAENDLLKMELDYLRAQAAMDNARLNFENMLFQLKSYLRIQDSRHLILKPPSYTEHFDVNAEKAVAEAKKNTATSLEFQERMITAESQVRQAKMDGRFDADLYLEYGLTQSTDEIQNVYTNPEDQQLLNLGISMPLLDWGKARGQIKVAQSNYELEQTSVEQDVIDYQQSVFLSVMQFNMQKTQLYIAAKADTVAQKRYDVTQKRYMIGQVNDVLELSNAQIDNDNARKGYYQALRSYWENYFELRKLTLYDFKKEQMLIFDIRDIM
jgi:outer membrane protein TolC